MSWQIRRADRARRESADKLNSIRADYRPVIASQHDRRREPKMIEAMEGDGTRTIKMRSGDAAVVRIVRSAHPGKVAC